MRRTIFTAIFALVFISLVNAQEYTTGIGIRGGLSQGLTIKHFVSESAALEGLVSTRWGGMHITGLYEIHDIAFDTPGLNWYYGFGGHIGFWNNRNDHPWFDDNGDYTVVGVDGILGLEYSFADFPVNISLDWKPALNLTGHTGFWGDNGAFSIRYIF